MDGYQLTASIIQSICSMAWPTAIVLSVWLFRTELVALLPKLTVKHKDWEMSFRLEQAEREAAALPDMPAQSPEQSPSPSEVSRFEQLAAISPRAAILEVRSDIVEAVRLTAAANNINPSNAPIINLLRALRNRGLLDDQSFNLLDELRIIGNNAAHISPPEYTKEEAIKYRDLAIRAWLILEGIRKTQQ